MSMLCAVIAVDVFSDYEFVVFCLMNMFLTCFLFTGVYTNTVRKAKFTDPIPFCNFRKIWRLAVLAKKTPLLKLVI